MVPTADLEHECFLLWDIQGEAFDRAHAAYLADPLTISDRVDLYMLAQDYDEGFVMGKLVRRYGFEPGLVAFAAWQAAGWKP